MCLCMAIEDAREQCLAFAKALHARGYPLDVIVRLLCKNDYGGRLVYLKLAQGQPPSGSTSRVNATSTMVTVQATFSARSGCGVSSPPHQICHSPLTCLINDVLSPLPLPDPRAVCSLDVSLHPLALKK